MMYPARFGIEMIHLDFSINNKSNCVCRIMLVPCRRMAVAQTTTTVLPNESFKHETYGNVLVCHVCGLIKRRTDFPLWKRTKQDTCRVCSYMKEHNLGWKHCESCGELKPKVAFMKKNKKMMKHCRHA